MKLRAATLLVLLFFSHTTHAEVPSDQQFYDSHFHLTNYVQQGISVQSFLKLMGERVGRSTLFGIPLQQQWSHRISGNDAPTYYLDTDAPLYYYSFTDAAIANEFLSLTPPDRKRFEPMITGFNPSDMYAVEHIKRVLKTYPGVFSGVGEFSIHKEFVSSKISGEIASLKDPALDRILTFCGESGLIVLIHNDIQTPFPKEGQKSAYYEQIFDLFKRHPKTTIIWAHMGLGRIIEPAKGFASLVEHILKDPKMKHVYFDISWDEVAKYLNATPNSLKNATALINQYPDRFLFGTDEVAPKSAAAYYKVFGLYEELWKGLTPEASAKVRKGNFEKLFDRAKTRVRAWEKSNL